MKKIIFVFLILAILLLVGCEERKAFPSPPSPPGDSSGIVGELMEYTNIVVPPGFDSPEGKFKVLPHEEYLSHIPVKVNVTYLNLSLIYRYGFLCSRSYYNTTIGKYACRQWDLRKSLIQPTLSDYDGNPTDWLAQIEDDLFDTIYFGRSYALPGNSYFVGYGCGKTDPGWEYHKTVVSDPENPSNSELNNLLADLDCGSQWIIHPITFEKNIEFEYQHCKVVDDSVIDKTDEEFGYITPFTGFAVLEPQQDYAVITLGYDRIQDSGFEGDFLNPNWGELNITPGIIGAPPQSDIAPEVFSYDIVDYNGDSVLEIEYNESDPDKNVSAGLYYAFKVDQPAPQVIPTPGDYLLGLDYKGKADMTKVKVLLIRKVGLLGQVTDVIELASLDDILETDYKHISIAFSINETDDYSLALVFYSKLNTPAEKYALLYIDNFKLRKILKIDPDTCYVYAGSDRADVEVDFTPNTFDTTQCDVIDSDTTYADVRLDDGTACSLSFDYGTETGLVNVETVSCWDFMGEVCDYDGENYTNCPYERIFPPRDVMACYLYGFIPGQEETPDEPPIITCNETDEGMDPYNMGTVTVYGQPPLLDHCIDSNHLIEYYCQNDVSVNLTLACSYGCVNGACLRHLPFTGANTTTVRQDECNSGETTLMILSEGHILPGYQTGDYSVCYDSSVLEVPSNCALGETYLYEEEGHAQDPDMIIEDIQITMEEDQEADYSLDTASGGKKDYNVKVLAITGGQIPEVQFRINGVVVGPLKEGEKAVLDYGAILQVESIMPSGGSGNDKVKFHLKPPYTGAYSNKYCLYSPQFGVSCEVIKGSCTGSDKICIAQLSDAVSAHVSSCYPYYETDYRVCCTIT